MRPLLASIILVFLTFIFSSPALAISQFSTKYDISYTVNPSGDTQVNYDIYQTNNLSSVYATQFSLSVSQTNLQNITAQEDSGPVILDVVRTDNLTNISFKFNQKVVGKDKVHHFGISYVSKDIATKIGSIWEINIPHLTGSEGITEVNTTLTVPPQFPTPAFVNPTPSKSENNIYYFNSSSTANQSISAVFGSNQYFRFTLFYNLTNDTSTKSTTNITLPPDTNYQQVYYQKIEPQPESVAIDPDGNWIATISLPPKTDIQVKAEGVVKLGLIPKKTVLSNRDLFLRATDLWPTEDPSIKQAASKLNTPEAIYQYVSDYLVYDYSRLNGDSKRKGALSALQNPANSICTEFADLFVTLARTINVPARELEGFAFTENERLRPLSLSKDILHAWPEYYDAAQQKWIQIDPTWSKTTQGVDYFHKLDLNHIVFAIHGISSVSPLPAGSYKTSSSNSRDVFVDPTTEVNFPRAITNAKILSADTKNLSLEIINQSGVSYQGYATITDPKINLSDSYSVNLPSFGSEVIEIPLKSKFSLQTIHSTINISLNGQNYTKDITYEPPYRQNLILIGGSFLVGSSSFIAWRLRLRKRRINPPVHW